MNELNVYLSAVNVAIGSITMIVVFKILLDDEKIFFWFNTLYDSIWRMSDYTPRDHVEELAKHFSYHNNQEGLMLCESLRKHVPKKRRKK